MRYIDCHACVFYHPYTLLWLVLCKPWTYFLWRRRLIEKYIPVTAVGS